MRCSGPSTTNVSPQVARAAASAATGSASSRSHGSAVSAIGGAGSIVGDALGATPGRYAATNLHADGVGRVTG